MAPHRSRQLRDQQIAKVVRDNRTYLHASSTCMANHPKSIPSFPDITISKYWNTYVLHEFRYGIPICMA